MAIAKNNAKDTNIVRDLAKRAAEIAALPVQGEKRGMWRRLNDLDPVRPMVLIFGGGITWTEIDDDSLVERASDPWYRAQEKYWRQLLFRWEHLPCDMVIEPFVECPMTIINTGCGFSGWKDNSLADRVIVNNTYKDIESRSFKPLIHSEADLEKFRLPHISVDRKSTNENFEKTKDLYDGIFEVRLKGITGGWHWPWNNIIAWLGIEESLIAMNDNPGLLHKIMRCVTDAELSALDQYRQLGLFSPSSGNGNTGNGGYAYSSELPSDGTVTGPQSLWCSTAAEIFTCVSPQMHKEFALDYEIEVLQQYGLTYYGCCERLDHKIDILKNIPNLRKISVSTWTKPEIAASEIGNQYVYSYKPDNTGISSFSWDAEDTRKTLKDIVKSAQKNNCPIEIIMNAVSTLHHEPRRIIEWARIAQKIAEG